ncbi:protein of unknown function [Nitrospira japonica]|uniref:Uncharacterized protein n=1 Tax=Nitrospira japonica TaxID=1325564 RepID=A0A1W1I6L2_9BACT|nr:protein of unknown function [Nitrospira japonica]
MPPVSTRGIICGTSTKYFVGCSEARDGEGAPKESEEADESITLCRAVCHCAVCPIGRVGVGVLRRRRSGQAAQ